MAVESTNSSVVYTVTSAASGQEFSIPFPYIKKEHVIAYYSDDGEVTNLTYGTGYTVSGTTLTVAVGLPVGAKLVIYRVTPLTQEIDWEDGQAVYTPDIEQADDKLTFIAQEFANQIDRAVKITNEDAASGVTPEDLRDDFFEARDAAEASATAASDSATLAQAWAQSSNPPDSEDSTSKSAKTWAGIAKDWAQSTTAPDPDDNDSKSAKSWAGEAASSATAASGSASAASGSATQAAAWAESDTAPDPNDPTSKSAKKWAEVASDNVPIATTNLAGKVKPDGTSIEVEEDGTISVPAATASAKGIVKPDGSTITIDADGVISAASASSATPVARSASGAVGTSTAYARADHSHPNNWGSTTVAAASPAVVVETWHSGTEWYRVWSDGWIEQGGQSDRNTTVQTVTLNKAFTGINYTAITNPVTTTTVTAGASYQSYVGEKTTSSFKAGNSNSTGATSKIAWVAFGF